MKSKEPPNGYEDQSMAQQNDSVEQMLRQFLTQQNTGIDELKKQMAELYGIVGQVAGMNTFGNVLENGFETLSDQLRPLEGLVDQLVPLRDLTPRRTHMNMDGYKRLRNLREAMARPKWTGAGSLSIAERRVPFIGEVAPPDPIPAYGQLGEIFVFSSKLTPEAPQDTQDEENTPGRGTSS